MKSSDSGDYMEILYRYHCSEKYIFVKTLFSTTAAMEATEAITWKPGLSCPLLNSRSTIQIYARGKNVASSCQKDHCNFPTSRLSFTAYLPARLLLM